MAKCAAAWLACWEIRHHARSRASVLRSRSQRRVIIGFCRSMETLEQSANFQNAADSVHRYRRDLAEFFDHLLRSEESYDQKWNYVRDNPVRANLAQKAAEWDIHWRN